jgi:glycogen synthase
MRLPDAVRYRRTTITGRALSICVCTRIYPSVGGIETLAEELANRWTAAGHSVVIVSDVRQNVATRRNFPFTVFYRPSPGQFLAAARQCDVFVHNNVSLKAIWPLLWVRRPYVAVHHSLYGVDGDRRSAREHWKLRIARRWAHNISVSRAVQRGIGVRGAMIPNLYDDAKFRLLPEAREKDLVFAGRLVSDKGADVLVRALSRLRSRNVCPSLSIVGDGPERPRLEGMVRETGLSDQVTFFGSRRHDELPRILNQHRIMVVPSLWNEPFGIVALEGAACGCAVVGSAGGGLPEAIGPCGVTFPNGDDQQLAAILEQLLASPAKLVQFRDASAAHLAKHQADVISAQYIDFFLSVLSEAGRWGQCAS